MTLKEYKPGTAFNGVVGRMFDTSGQAWPEPLRARTSASNVLFIVLDDVGFGRLGCFWRGAAGRNFPACSQGVFE